MRFGPHARAAKFEVTLSAIVPPETLILSLIYPFVRSVDSDETTQICFMSSAINVP